MENFDKVLDSAIVKPVADSLRPFCQIAIGALDESVVAAILCTARSNSMHEDDIEQIVRWASSVQTQASMLRMVLIGATEAFVQNGEVHFRMPGDGPDEMMRQLVRNKIATPAKTKKKRNAAR